MKMKSKSLVVPSSDENAKDTYRKSVITAMMNLYGVEEKEALTAVLEQDKAFLRLYDDGIDPERAALELKPEDYDEYKNFIISMLIRDYSLTKEQAGAVASQHEALFRERFNHHIPPEEWIDQILQSAPASKELNPDKTSIEQRSDGIYVLPSKKIDGYLEKLLCTGLFGDSREQVILTMINRGIETVMPALDSGEVLK